MLNQDFCDHLEFSLSKALSSSDNSELRYLWCDGIEITASSLNGQDILTGKTWIGIRDNKRQEIYNLTIKLGDNTLAVVHNNDNPSKAIPRLLPEEWFKIDVESKHLNIILP